MNYLELVQRAIRYSGARVEEPTTLVGASNEVLLFADFVEQAWTELQIERNDWLWNTRSRFSGILKEDTYKMYLRGEIAGPDNTFTGFVDDTLDPVAITAGEMIQKFKECTVRISADDVLEPEAYLHFLPWELWNDLAADERTGTPSWYTVDSEGVLRFMPVADQDYRIYVEAGEAPQVLEADEDVPEGLATFLHMIIVWRAIIFYGMYRSDQSIIAQAQQREEVFKKRMESMDMPRVRMIKDALYRRRYY